MPGNHFSRKMKSLGFRFSEKSGLNRTEKKQTKSIINRTLDTKMEHKWVDLQTTGSSSYTWTVSSMLNTITQGATGNGTRVGDRIRIKKIVLDAGVSYADSTNLSRLVLVRWLANTTPTTAQMFTDDVTVYAPLSLYEEQYKKGLFQVIYDKTLKLSSVGPGVAHVKKTIRFPKNGKQVYFNAGAATIASGDIFLCHCTDSIAAAHPTLTYNVRLYYSDL